jgi:hypothetical protein
MFISYRFGAKPVLVIQGPKESAVLEHALAPIAELLCEHVPSPLCAGVTHMHACGSVYDVRTRAP